jgi:hypothetical protein
MYEIFRKISILDYCFVLGFLILMPLIYMSLEQRNSEKRLNVITYDCRMLIGGWHPDFPPQVMEECRKRSGRI